MSIFYFVAGASGSGKSAILSDLKRILSGATIVYDFDDIGVPEGADKKWRQESTEKWLQKLLRENKNACLLGQMVLGEILACPSAKHLEKVHFCLLDVTDIERIKRLKNRNTYGADQNMLNWAAWLRMHHYDPQWAQHVIKNDCWNGLDFSMWDKLEDWGSKAIIKYLDTTEFSISTVAEHVADCIFDCVSGRNSKNNNANEPEPIPNSPFKLYKNPNNAFNIIDEKLFAFNKKCVPPIHETAIYKNYFIKENDLIIGGICADIDVWNILYIDLLFVEDAYRNKDLGSFLIKRVEEEAKTAGATLAHTNTYDFQAKDFYLKHGYEIFGVLEDCPQGHKRYYLKKNLQ